MMNSIERMLIPQLLNRVSAYGLARDQAIAVAYSGGPDSTALLELLVRCRDRGLLAHGLSALYVNHRLRSSHELDAEVEQISEYCTVRNVPLTVIDLGDQTVYKYAWDHDQSIEEAARFLRYQALREYTSNEAVFTAHTRDDQSETLIMRFFSGSGITGLTGIPETRPPFYRPLLEHSKEQLMKFLEQTGTGFCEDSTNRGVVYRRNQLRDLLPEIQRVFPGYQRALDALLCKMQWVRESLDASDVPLTQTYIDLERETVIFSLEEFTRLSPYQRMEQLFSWWNSCLGREGESLPFDSLRPFLDWCTRQNELRRRIPVFDLYQSSLEVKGDRVFWRRAVAQKEKKGYLKAVTAGSTLLCDGIYLCVRESDQFTPDTIALVKERLQLPLVVRSPKDGDVISSTGGTKRLSKLLSDWKVPRQMRWMIPVIEDRSGIQAVLGSALGYHDRAAAEHTRTIRDDQRYLLFSLEIIGSEN